ncbi:akirin-2 isoform X2 [Bubalus kerabau]|uniref:akirin-2 isoform X2 n=1 Tax=Bubalus carabanensis TaxID=3119969 RepID=UPI00244E8DFB|nr:akirin-2 isoform X2 [Bubalus carabanensis]
MEAQENRHKRAREPDGDSDSTSESGLESSKTEELTPTGEEQILYNIKQEYKRMQKRRHLETSFQQTDPCCTSDAQPHAFLLSGPGSPGTPSGTSSPLKKEQPLFTLRQVGMICERLLKEREEKVREEYEEILNTKLAEQYDAFVKFTHDQIMRRYGEQPASYVS